MYVDVHVNSRYSCQILRKLGFCRRIFAKYSSIRFHKSPASGCRVVACWQTNRHTHIQTDRLTDTHDEAFRNFANARSKRKVKVKCTLVQALRLCIGCTAHRGSRGIALPFYDHGTRRQWGFSVTLWPLFTPGKDPVPIVQEAGWAPGPVWTGAENLAADRDSIPGPSSP